MILRLLLASALLLAGCVQLPPTPQDLQAKKFETLPDQAVIYVVRDYPDFADAGATINLGDTGVITTYPGTYYRWEVPPGAHCISGYAGDSGTITLNTEAGKLYFVQQRVSLFMQFLQSQFYRVAEPAGQAIVRRSVLAGGR